MGASSRRKVPHIAEITFLGSLLSATYSDFGSRQHSKYASAATSVPEKAESREPAAREAVGGVSATLFCAWGVANSRANIHRSNPPNPNRTNRKRNHTASQTAARHNRPVECRSRQRRSSHNRRQVARLHALLPHLLTHLHEPRNAVLNRRMRGKQAREALRRERTGDHHRSHRLPCRRSSPSASRLRRRKSCSTRKRALPDPPSTWNRLRRRRIRVCGRLPSVSATLRSRQESCSAHTQQSQAAGRRIVAVVTRTAAAEIHGASSRGTR